MSIKEDAKKFEKLPSGLSDFGAADTEPNNCF